MYRTLVADDDFLVRSYLKTLDSWEKAGYEIVDDAEDGEEAYGFLQKEKIDVLVTDLTMPVMDGIELIRKIREENRDIYIIVLSCHDDFEYVKEAMRLGADEYVLKNSLDEDSLYDTLEKSARLIENRRKKSQEQAQARKLIHLGSHALKYYFFNGLISGMLKNQAREEKRVEAGIAGKYFNSAVICMFMERWAERERQWTPLEVEQYSHHFRHRLLERTEELLGTESEFTEVIYLGAGIFSGSFQGLQDFSHAAEADRGCGYLLPALPGGFLRFRHQCQQCLHGRGRNPSGLPAGQRNDETAFL